jgi:nicotinamidase-related amidase
MPNSDIALLLLDPHRQILAQLPPELAASVSAAMITALAASRGAGIQIIYVIPHYRPGYPGLSPKHSYVRDKGLFSEPSNADGLPTAFARLAKEPIVVKYAYSPFFGTDLELLLRRGGIKRLVLGGVSTSGVVFSAVRDAFDMDFDITVLHDGCGDFDPEIHALCMNKLFPAQAEILAAAQWAAQL